MGELEHHLVASSFNITPFFSIVPDNSGNVTVSGFCVDIFSWLSSFLKIQITYAAVTPFQVQLYGATKAMINQLINKETDIFFFALVPTLEKMKLMDFTYPMTNGDFRLMLPYPDKENNSITVMVDIISPQVWAVTFTLIVFGILIICAYQYRYLTSESKSIESISDFLGRRVLYFVLIFSGRSGNGNYFTFPYNTRFAVRIIVGVWILMISFTLLMFPTFLISHLTVPKFNPIINSLKELAASQQYKLVEPMDSDLADFFLNAESEPYKSLGDSLRNLKPSISMANLTGELYNVLLNLKGAYLQDVWVTQIHIGRDMKNQNGTCRFTASRILKEISKPFPMALRKGDPNVERINRGVMRLRESGLVDHWISSYMSNIDKCLIKENNSFRDEISSFTAMNLSHHIGTFFIIFIGSSLSLLSFFCELVVFKMM